MFDSVRNNKRIVQVFLLAITVPFAVWGLDSYFRSDGGTAQVAKVGGIKITLNQFQQALREQQDKMRTQLPGIDAKLLDSPAIRQSVLNGLVDQQLLLQEVTSKRMGVSVSALQETIASIPAFQENGQFSAKRYEEVLAREGMSPAGFEAQLRRDMALQYLIGAVGESAFVPHTITQQVVALQNQVRQVQESIISAQDLQGSVKVEAAELEQAYKERQDRYTLPEQVKVEYVVLSQKDMDAQYKADEAEVKAWYEGHKDQYSEPEERRASHILLLTEGQDKDKVKAEAEALLAEVQKAPAKFADLAKQRSQDPGSAAKGGDLGFFGKGAMVKSFEDSVFSLEKGQMSGLVESDYGFHIIKVTDIRPAQVKSLAQVRAGIEADLKQQHASRRFAEAAENFSNMVYEQSDSLKPVMDKFGLKAQQSQWLTRQAGPAAGILNNAKLMEALFGDDVVKNGRNTEAVEVAPGTLVSARLVEYKPAALRPLESVKGEIEAALKADKAMAKAVEQGKAALAELNSGKDGIKWSAALSVSRMAPGKLAGPALSAVARVDTKELPGYAGVELPGVGYGLYKVLKVEAGQTDEKLTQALGQQLNSINARAQVEAYMAALRKRYKVEINTEALGAKE